MSEPASSADVDATRLSMERTYIGADRTLMASVRTAFAMITFGFTIYQTFAFGSRARIVLDEPAGRLFAIALIALGVLLPALAVWSHVRGRRALTANVERLRRLGVPFDAADYPARPAFALAFLTLLLGVAALSCTTFQFFAAA